MPSIDEIANIWAVGWHEGTLDTSKKAELEAWLALDRRHRGAYLRARAHLQWADDQKHSLALPANGAEEREACPAVHHGAWGRGVRTKAAWGAAFMAVAASVVAFGLWIATPDYSTRIGQYREVALADGSLAALNTDSALDIAYKTHHRQLTLRKGEAWFRVAHDSGRPFEVRVGAVRVRATGTAFAVRSMEGGVKVVVTEGHVLAWVEGAEREPVSISKGDHAFLREGGGDTPDRIILPAPVKVDMEQVLAWRRGAIGFDGQTGEEAAREFNRYSEQQIRIENPQAARYEIAGYFQTNQSLAFAKALARMTGSELSYNGNEIVVK